MNTNILLQTIHENVLVLTFNHEKITNPFSDELQAKLIECLNLAQEDNAIDAIVLYGGDNRHFSAGGDFAEAITMREPKLIESKLLQVCNFYQDILKIDKPIVAAIDRYAIGIGFQVAILTDYRIGTNGTIFYMPELINGVGVPLGSAMTEFIFGRFIMQEICFHCEKITAEQCLSLKLINEITSKDNLLSRAIEKAKHFGKYPKIAYRGSKHAANKRFIEVIELIKEDTVKVHTDVFVNEEHVRHMSNILNKNK